MKNDKNYANKMKNDKNLCKYIYSSREIYKMNINKNMKNTMWRLI